MNHILESAIPDPSFTKRLGNIRKCFKFEVESTYNMKSYNKNSSVAIPKTDCSTIGGGATRVLILRWNAN
jgi:hypothetical protein